jgi:hypothetical protein
VSWLDLVQKFVSSGVHNRLRKHFGPGEEYAKSKSQAELYWCGSCADIHVSQLTAAESGVESRGQSFWWVATLALLLPLLLPLRISATKVLGQSSSIDERTEKSETTALGPLSSCLSVMPVLWICFAS